MKFMANILAFLLLDLVRFYLPECYPSILTEHDVQLCMRPFHKNNIATITVIDSSLLRVKEYHRLHCIVDSTGCRLFSLFCRFRLQRPLAQR